MKPKDRLPDFEMVLAMTSEIRAIADEYPNSRQAKKLYALLAQVQSAYAAEVPTPRMKITRRNKMGCRCVRCDRWLTTGPVCEFCGYAGE